MSLHDITKSTRNINLSHMNKSLNNACKGPMWLVGMGSTDEEGRVDVGGH